MVFKIDIKSNNKINNIINGGRYDQLISDLGSTKQISAVEGCLKFKLLIMNDIINIGIPSKGRLRKDVLKFLKEKI